MLYREGIPPLFIPHPLSSQLILFGVVLTTTRSSSYLYYSRSLTFVDQQCSSSSFRCWRSWR